MYETQRRKDKHMKYIARYNLGKNKYLAVLDGSLVIVTTDNNGNPIRWAIFKK